ncbi:protein of unknown function [Magnetospirillum gryphiswaldense MSR-1 v2]|uniref:Uncharacterized protein n=1 Tax=Magnetospirillum gryphiswaldense (strain DSM 6361 / JCM 21280 / NBRC 15271 / MSR-1) TaxID=431944 RepID=V6F6B5_MAGGM|nr:protein of unknown function [Magnetospirillum gryphiswaldense MSR-1 v2]
MGLVPYRYYFTLGQSVWRHPITAHADAAVKLVNQADLCAKFQWNLAFLLPYRYWR